MAIRDLSLSDLDVITEIDQLCFPPGIAFDREVFEYCLSQEFCRGFGVEREGRLAAFAIINFTGPRSMQIVTIDVLPEHRGQGLARTIMSEIEGAARGHDVRRIVLQVSTQNETAIALYQKWGFQIKSVLPDYYARGMDAFLMDKKILPQT